MSFLLQSLLDRICLLVFWLKRTLASDSLPMRVKVATIPAILPRYMSTGAAGMDVFAAIEREITIAPLGRVLIPTGWCFAISDGFELQVRPRSGLSLKHGITCTTGTIDSDYRGEVQVLLFNISNEPFVVTPRMRIAQLVCSKVQRVELLPSPELKSTARGVGGFGHTGQ